MTKGILESKWLHFASFGGKQENNNFLPPSPQQIIDNEKLEALYYAWVKKLLPNLTAMTKVYIIYLK